MTEERLLTTFSLADLSLAVDVDKVQEVIRHLEITRVPLAPPAVSGLINLRGHIITAIDARRSLGLPARPPGQPSVHLILRMDDGLVSLLVDDIGGVVQFGERDYESPPATLKGKLRDLVSGAYKVPGQLLLILDIERLLTEASAEIPAVTFDHRTLVQ
jgi:purine-binding chemotaxis protein CheW